MKIFFSTRELIHSEPGPNTPSFSRAFIIISLSTFYGMTFSYSEAANQIADAWGEALTNMMRNKDCEALVALCEPVVQVTLPTSEPGTTATFSIGAGEAASISWQEFAELSGSSLEEQDFASVEAACTGILGNRMILETARINSKDEIYMNAFAVLTLSPEGKVASFESFADSVAPAVIDVALAKDNADAVVESTI